MSNLNEQVVEPPADKNTIPSGIRLSEKSRQYMLATPEPNPLGLCKCGCGEKTKIARQNAPKYGWVFGKPISYTAGHHGYKSLVEYIETDCGYGTKCWIWQRYINRDGYGVMSRDHGKGVESAHRGYYKRAKGSIPDDLELDHLCRNRACVNPDHLETVTSAVNTRRGAAAKLTEDAVREIIRLRKNGVTYRNLSKMFNVSTPALFSVCKGRTWKGVMQIENLPIIIPLDRLSAADVREIRQLRVNGVLGRVIAERFSITLAYVFHIAAGRVRKDVAR